jgi:hypothetical protein
MLPNGLLGLGGLYTWAWPLPYMGPRSLHPVPLPRADVQDAANVNATVDTRVC